MLTTISITILGLGFTGQRLARRLAGRNVSVWAAVRGGRNRFQPLIDAGARLVDWENALKLPRDARLLHSIPPLPPGESDALHALIEGLAPERVVYISSTGVYGAAEDVDETTAAAPDDDRGRFRLVEEDWVRSGPWSSLILRSAAIYGPGRGVHAAVREGRAPRGVGAGVVSRIHVDDLAALAESALFAYEPEGAWPVADDLPCSSAEIVQWCGGTPARANASVVKGRRVDGRKIRELLGVELRYPSWKTGVPAALEEEDGR